jgi:hypothetical protein
VEEAFKEALTSLQQDGKLYLIEEEWDVRRNKRKAENYSNGGVGKGGGRDRVVGATVFIGRVVEQAHR